jgi:hypothetical protein
MIKEQINVLKEIIGQDEYEKLFPELDCFIEWMVVQEDLYQMEVMIDEVLSPFNTINS